MMTCYIVAFEPGKDQSNSLLIEQLKTFDRYCPINASCWAIMSDKTPADIATLVGQGSPTARVFVVRSGTAAAWLNAYGEKNSEWLKKNL